RQHGERGHMLRSRPAPGESPRLEQRDNHDGLPQPHVVREASAKAELPQERKPSERIALIVAQRAGERRGRIERLDAGERLQGLTRPDERFVYGNRRLAREERVEQRRLRWPEANVIPLRLPESRDSGIAFQ